METKKREKRKLSRIPFAAGFNMKILAIDGSWYRDCAILDVSETGALLQFKASLSGLELSEFFLMLSSSGLAYRRCRLAWVNGDRIGVNFLKGDERAPARAGSRRSDTIVEV